jgi:hypothetical protein
MGVLAQVENGDKHCENRNFMQPMRKLRVLFFALLGSGREEGGFICSFFAPIRFSNFSFSIPNNSSIVIP